MDLSTVILAAVGLSMDCLAVSVASGLSIKNVRIVHALKIGVFFGGFPSTDADNRLVFRACSKRNYFRG